MGVKEFFETANAVEYGMRRAMESARPASDPLSSTAETKKLIKDNERMLAELKAQRHELADALVSSGLAQPGDTVNQARDRLASELSDCLSHAEALAYRCGALEASTASTEALASRYAFSNDPAAWTSEVSALLADLADVRARVHQFNMLVPPYDAVII